MDNNHQSNHLPHDARERIVTERMAGDGEIPDVHMEESPQSNAMAATTHGNASAAVSGHSIEQPIERLIRVIKSMSAEARTAAVDDIWSVVRMMDRAPDGGEGLVSMTESGAQERNYPTQDNIQGTRKMRRFFEASPSWTSDLESSSSAEWPKIIMENNHELLKEIKRINQRLVDTRVSISDKDDVNITITKDAAENNNGTIVKCSYNAVALGPHLKSHYLTLSPIQPLRLFVPSDYPNRSPQFLDKFPAEVSDDFEDLSLMVKSRFGVSIQGFGKALSLEEIVKTWDGCTREVIHEYAKKRGGGTFSSIYGAWENCPKDDSR